MCVTELLNTLEMGSLTFEVKTPIYLHDFEKFLISNNWEKVYTEEDSGWYGNFIVVFKKGNHEITLFCDPDGYVIEFTITKR